MQGRVPTCPGNPGNPGNVLEFFSVLENVLEMVIFGEMSWNCPGNYKSVFQKKKIEKKIEIKAFWEHLGHQISKFSSTMVKKIFQIV